MKARSWHEHNQMGTTAQPTKFSLSTTKDIASEFATNFAGMTAEPVALESLLAARARLRTELPSLLTDRHRSFLVGLTRAQPDWTLLECPYATELPALRWKLANLLKFSESARKISTGMLVN